MKKNYIGHIAQVCDVEEHRLIGGKGDGMRILEVRNGNGLEFTVTSDRCADISRVTYKGVNMNFFSPCGYVSPQYYDKSPFGFLTTCGLTAIEHLLLKKERNFHCMGIYHMYQQSRFITFKRMKMQSYIFHQL